MDDFFNSLLVLALTEDLSVMPDLSRASRQSWIAGSSPAAADELNECVAALGFAEIVAPSVVKPPMDRGGPRTFVIADLRTNQRNRANVAY